jgi:hypothetical protein
MRCLLHYSFGQECAKWPVYLLQLVEYHYLTGHLILPDRVLDYSVCRKAHYNLQHKP